LGRCCKLAGNAVGLVVPYVFRVAYMGAFPASCASRRGSRLARGRADRGSRVRLAMATATLWVLDDAFWHREPGTSLGDHLVSGLVPVALATLLALAYPRLRSGARAAAALAAGPLMMVVGVARRTELRRSS
jgi:hypothetical protein